MIHMSCLVLFQFLFDFAARGFCFPDPLSDFGLGAILLGCWVCIMSKNMPRASNITLPDADSDDLAQPLLSEDSGIPPCP
mmetsp:Transcript_47187/g.94602  ORF Transcript_47187/g.94602 Transcript_47187/m.94602 type:complete len:80 (+) Transcript_47187:214-453(+)